MMIRALISLLLASLSIVPGLSQVMSYAKVSRNGQEEAETRNDPVTWIVRLDRLRDSEDREMFYTKIGLLE